MCVLKTMNPASESLRPKRSARRLAAKGNCVAVRRGGEQLEADSQSTTEVPTSVNPFRPAISASLHFKGEACGGGPSVGLSRSHPASKGEDREVEGGWGWNERKSSWRTAETRRRRMTHWSDGGSQSVHRSAEAANPRGAKGRRKVNA